MKARTLTAPAVIGYRYGKGAHCGWCARDTFGDKLDGAHLPTDDEGNDIRPILASDPRDPKGEICGECSTPIYEATS